MTFEQGVLISIGMVFNVFTFLIGFLAGAMKRKND
jgi:hypothetical protein